ncbi:sulfatase [Halomarina litorea]|uniref:sulfatase n=1 Tax=Halomarina litorea TaxID=2961595 RepID=UPI0020C5A7A2|nr:sulfatase [Halomarina sp. BCD28]
MTETPPSVVWLTLESVRYDATSLSGYHRDTTPNLRRIANAPDGVSFEKGFAQSLWTPACTASILTGTYPVVHRVGMDGLAKEPLPESVRTLPELLSAAGYRTTAISPNAYISGATGLDRGFERFEWFDYRKLFERDSLGPWLKYFANIRSYGPPAIHRRYYEEGNRFYQALQRVLFYGVSTFTLADVFEGWLTELAAGDDPFFSYIHLPNPHHPYNPPRKFIDRFTDDIEYSTAEALRLSYDLFGSSAQMKRRIATGNGTPLDDAEREALRALYDAELLYVDETVGRLFDHVRALDEDVIVVVTGDHGDLFGEQGVIGHNLVLHDGLTNVPLVVSGLPGIERARDGFAQHIDVTRTLADHLGVSDPQFQGTNLTERSLDHAISQRGIAHFDNYLEHNYRFDVSPYHREPITALRTDHFKYVVSDEREELYVFPVEGEDVSDQFPAVCERFRSHLVQRFADVDADLPSAGRVELSPEMEEQLQRLGYL